MVNVLRVRASPKRSNVRVLYRSRARTQTGGLDRSSGSHFTEVRSDMPAKPRIKKPHLRESSGNLRINLRHSLLQCCGGVDDSVDG